MITGGCFCGVVTYRVSGPLQDARSCHCSRCRKVFSAQASAYALVNPADFEWTQGKNLLTAYVNQAGVGYQFCSVCGSTLCGIFQGQIHGIMLGCVDGDPGIKLQRHIYVGSKAKWEEIAAGIPQYEENMEGDTIAP
ncbi:MAG: GFA family protein [Acidobacteria bacterium]|nr:GFA family protein [Acidobacteriota bacterium]